MVETGVLEYWRDKHFLLRLLVRPGMEKSDKVHDFLKTGFELRDSRIGTPNYQRYEDNIFTTSFWELAEAFFPHFTSLEFADRLREYSVDPDGDAEKMVQEGIRVLDEFYRYGFVFTSKKQKVDQHRFWQIYIPGMSST